MTQFGQAGHAGDFQAKPLSDYVEFYKNQK
jgi:hypothetical protein